MNHLNTLPIWTDDAIAALPQRDSSYEIIDPLTPGLSLLVGPTGIKSFSFTWSSKETMLISIVYKFDLVPIEVVRAYANKIIARFSNF